MKRTPPTLRVPCSHALLACSAVMLCIGCNDSKPPPIALPEAPVFRPEGALPQVALLALLVPDTQIAELLQAGGVRTGQLRLSGGNRGALWVQTKAALQGATHVALTQSQMATFRKRGPFDTATRRCQQSASGQEAMVPSPQRCEAAAPVGGLDEVSLQSFQLITVPVERWNQLPEGFRPTLATGSEEDRGVPSVDATPVTQ